MNQETKKVIIYNYYYIINGEQRNFENIKSLSSLNNLIKTSIDNISKSSSSIQVPGSKDIIKNEEIFNNISFSLNKENKCKSFEKEKTLETTKRITIEKIENEEENKFLSKKRYFEINTINKRGRKPKNLNPIICHTKFSNDNILRKIKVKFFHKLINYINSIIISKYRNKINTLKNLEGKISRNNTINFNKELLSSKLKDILSNHKINGKFKEYGCFYNKEIIEKIYKEKIQELIDILDKTFLEVFKIFRDKNEVQQLNGLEKVDTVIEEILLKNNNEEYTNKFREIVMNFENYYLNKGPRK